MKAPISKILHFPAGERLMCPNCGTVSNNHKPHSIRTEYYWDTRVRPSIVFLHTCCRCGYTDSDGPGFIDSGNDHTEDFVNMAEWEREERRLQDELDELRRKIARGKALWDRRWNSTEDSQ